MQYLLRSFDLKYERPFIDTRSFKSVEKLDLECGDFIFQSIRNKSPELLGLLLASGANMEVRDCSNSTPLMDSLAIGSTKCTEVLLRAGAEIDSKTLLPSIKHNKNQEEEYLMIIKELKARGLINYPIFHDQSLLSNEVEAGAINLVRLLLGAGANVDARNLFGQTPLMTAVKAGKKDIVKMLLGAGANVDARDPYGQTPLMTAVKASRNKYDRTSSMVLKRAYYSDLKEIIQMLIRAGAEL